MTDTAISPLRRRMIEDMTIRGFAAQTQTGYLRSVRDFAAFLGRPPDTAHAEDPRRYQLHPRSGAVSATSLNAAVSALRFFFGVTLGRDDANRGMTTVRVCSAQKFGSFMSSDSRLALRSRGWRPRRIVWAISGARKLNRTTRLK